MKYCYISNSLYIYIYIYTMQYIDIKLYYTFFQSWGTLLSSECFTIYRFSEIELLLILVYLDILLVYFHVTYLAYHCQKVFAWHLKVWEIVLVLPSHVVYFLNCCESRSRGNVFHIVCSCCINNSYLCSVSPLFHNWSPIVLI